jgi:hypothetical protein
MQGQVPSLNPLVYVLRKALTLTNKGLINYLRVQKVGGGEI